MSAAGFLTDYEDLLSGLYFTLPGGLVGGQLGVRAAPLGLSLSPRVDCKHTHTNTQTCDATPSHPRLPKYSEDLAQEVQPQTTYSIFPEANPSVFSLSNKHTGADAGPDAQSLT